MESSELIRKFKEFLEFLSEKYDIPLEDFIDSRHTSETLKTDIIHEIDSHILELLETLGEFSKVYSNERYDGNDTEDVYYFKNYDIYIMIPGWYTSYNGTEYETDFKEVWPYEFIETRYSTVKD